MLKIYVLCIDRQAGAANKRITDTHGIQDAWQDLGDEGDSYSEQASRNVRSEATHGKYRRAGWAADLTVFERRGHSLVVDSGWGRVAGKCCPG